MKKDIETLKKEVETLTNSWKRALADYQNLEKRYEREKADFVQYANSRLILRLLEVLEHLEKAAETLKDKGLDLV
ncbi:MAG: nucleotide exchange factor GrpE, partial [Microgenomates group bacterium]